MKLTEESLNLVIDILNDLICEGKMLNDVERRSLLNAVMAITAVKERSVVSVSSRKEQSKKEKKEREIDPRFPNAGVAWNEADESLLRDVLEDVPDDEIGKHLFWLAEKLGRTPYSVACKVRQIKKLPAEWKDQFRTLQNNRYIFVSIRKCQCISLEGCFRLKSACQYRIICPIWSNSVVFSLVSEITQTYYR